MAREHGAHKQQQHLGVCFVQFGVRCLPGTTYDAPNHSIPPHIDVDLFDDEEAAHLQLTREEWEVCFGGSIHAGKTHRSVVSSPPIMI